MADYLLVLKTLMLTPWIFSILEIALTFKGLVTNVRTGQFYIGALSLRALTSQLACCLIPTESTAAEKRDSKAGSKG